MSNKQVYGLLAGLLAGIVAKKGFQGADGPKGSFAKGRNPSNNGRSMRNNEGNPDPKYGRIFNKNDQGIFLANEKAFIKDLDIEVEFSHFLSDLVLRYTMRDPIINVFNSDGTKDVLSSHIFKHLCVIFWLYSVDYFSFKNYEWGSDISKIETNEYQKEFFNNCFPASSLLSIYQEFLTNKGKGVSSRTSEGMYGYSLRTVKEALRMYSPWNTDSDKSKSTGDSVLDAFKVFSKNLKAREKKRHDTTAAATSIYSVLCQMGSCCQVAPTKEYVDLYSKVFLDDVSSRIFSLFSNMRDLTFSFGIGAENAESIDKTGVFYNVDFYVRMNSFFSMNKKRIEDTTNLSTRSTCSMLDVLRTNAFHDRIRFRDLSDKGFGFSNDIDDGLGRTESRDVSLEYFSLTMFLDAVYSLTVSACQSSTPKNASMNNSRLDFHVYKLTSNICIYSLLTKPLKNPLIITSGLPTANVLVSPNKSMKTMSFMGSSFISDLLPRTRYGGGFMYNCSQYAQITNKLFINPPGKNPELAKVASCILSNEIEKKEIRNPSSSMGELGLSSDEEKELLDIYNKYFTNFVMAHKIEESDKDREYYAPSETVRELLNLLNTIQSLVKEFLSTQGPASFGNWDVLHAGNVSSFLDFYYSGIAADITKIGDGDKDAIFASMKSTLKSALFFRKDVKDRVISIFDNPIRFDDTIDRETFNKNDSSKAYSYDRMDIMNNFMVVSYGSKPVELIGFSEESYTMISVGSSIKSEEDTQISEKVLEKNLFFRLENNKTVIVPITSSLSKNIGSDFGLKTPGFPSVEMNETLAGKRYLPYFDSYYSSGPLSSLGISSAVPSSQHSEDVGDNILLTPLSSNFSRLSQYDERERPVISIELGAIVVLGSFVSHVVNTSAKYVVGNYCFNSCSSKFRDEKRRASEAGSNRVKGVKNKQDRLDQKKRKNLDKKKKLEQQKKLIGERRLANLERRNKQAAQEQAARILEQKRLVAQKQAARISEQKRLAAQVQAARVAKQQADRLAEQAREAAIIENIELQALRLQIQALDLEDAKRAEVRAQRLRNQRKRLDAQAQAQRIKAQRLASQALIAQQQAANRGYINDIIEAKTPLESDEFVKVPKKYIVPKEFSSPSECLRRTINIAQYDLGVDIPWQWKVLCGMKEVVSNIRMENIPDPDQYDRNRIIKPWTFYQRIFSFRNQEDLRDDLVSMSNEHYEIVQDYNCYWAEMTNSCIEFNIPLESSSNIFASFENKWNSGFISRVVENTSAILKSVFVGALNKVQYTDFIVEVPYISFTTESGEVKSYNNICVTYRLIVSGEKGHGEWVLEQIGKGSIDSDIRGELGSLWISMVSIMRNHYEKFNYIRRKPKVVEGQIKTNNPGPRSPVEEKDTEYNFSTKMIKFQRDTEGKPIGRIEVRNIYLPGGVVADQSGKPIGEGWTPPSYKSIIMSQHSLDDLSEEERATFEDSNLRDNPYGYMWGAEMVDGKINRLSKSNLARRVGRNPGDTAYFPLSDFPAESIRQQDFLWNNEEERVRHYYKVWKEIFGWRRLPDGRIVKYDLPYLSIVDVV